MCVVLLRFLPYFIAMDFIDRQYGHGVGQKIYYLCLLDYSYAPMVFDVHTVGVGCIIQVCNMSVCCYECRDWSDSFTLALPHS